MNEKKSSKADLEPRRITFIEIGMVFALSLILFAFEMRQYDREIIDLGTVEAKEDLEETVLQTEQQEQQPQQEQQQTTILEVVDDEVVVDDDMTFDAETDLDTKMEKYVPSAQEEEETGEAEIFTVVEDMPDFPGGFAALQTYLYENIKYPEMAKQTGTEGKVYITFVVKPDGTLSDIKCIKDIGGGCGDEGIRVVKMMPKWKPGKQRGKPVPVRMSIPILFELQ